MRRVSAGKRVELTNRDIELFKLLNRYRYLRSNFLYSFLGGNSETRFKERLGHLYHDGRYINRPPQQWQFANCRHMPLIYELDDKGEQVLRQQGLSQSDSPLLQKGRTGACRQFAHELMICDCIASIELGVRQDTALRFISWQEIIAKAPEETRSLHNPFELPVSISHAFSNAKDVQRADIKIVPDALFGLEYTANGQKSYRFFVLEADRGQMPVARSKSAPEQLFEKDFGLPGDRGAEHSQIPSRDAKFPCAERHHERSAHEEHHGAARRGNGQKRKPGVSLQNHLDARRFSNSAGAHASYPHGTLAARGLR